MFNTFFSRNINFECAPSFLVCAPITACVQLRGNIPQINYFLFILKKVCSLYVIVHADMKVGFVVGETTEKARTLKCVFGQRARRTKNSPRYAKRRFLLGAAKPEATQSCCRDLQGAP